MILVLINNKENKNNNNNLLKYNYLFKELNNIIVDLNFLLLLE